MSRVPIDLGYTHEMAVNTIAATTPQGGPRRIVGSDLTARLACLKSLDEAERNGRLSFCTRMAMLAKSSRHRVN